MCQYATITCSHFSYRSSNTKILTLFLKEGNEFIQVLLLIDFTCVYQKSKIIYEQSIIATYFSSFINFLKIGNHYSCGKYSCLNKYEYKINMLLSRIRCNFTVINPKESERNYSVYFKVLPAFLLLLYSLGV